jgi:hypothetical protein
MVLLVVPADQSAGWIKATWQHAQNRPLRPLPRTDFRKAKHPYPPKIDRDNRDNRDKSPKPLQRKDLRLENMTNEPGQRRDKPGHFFAGRVTTAHFSAFHWK